MHVRVSRVFFLPRVSLSVHRFRDIRYQREWQWCEAWRDRTTVVADPRMATCTSTANKAEIADRCLFCIDCKFLMTFFETCLLGRSSSIVVWMRPSAVSYSQRIRMRRCVRPREFSCRLGRDGAVVLILFDECCPFWVT